MSTVSPKNLWGELPTTTNLRTPAIVLREQAAIFNDRFHGTLRAEIDSGGSKPFSGSSKLIHRMFIVAPALNDYRADILEVRHNIDLTSLTVLSDSLRNGQVECKRLEDFEVIIGEVLASERTRKIVEVLLAQATA